MRSGMESQFFPLALTSVKRWYQLLQYSMHMLVPVGSRLFDEP
jgi:hypothetical protein